MKEKDLKVVIGIVEKNGKVLMVRRAISEGKLLWSFPGGKMSATDGSEEDTVTREVMEETNIRCVPVFRLGERTHPDTGKDIVYWRCQYTAGEPAIQDIEEIAEIRWVPPEKVSELVTSDIFAPVQSLLQELSEQ